MEKFDYKGVLVLLKKLNDDQAKIDIKSFLEVCKAFTMFSAGMGSLMSWGFDDIHTKSGALMKLAAKNPDCPTIQQLIEKEMAQNIHVLNGSNGEKMGRKEGDPYYKYESASRTILRLLYFLTLITHLTKNMRTYPEELLSNVAKKSYADSIESFHPPVLREGIKAAFLTVPTRKEFMESAFGSVTKQEFNDILGEILKPLATFVARMWKYYKDKNITNLE